MRKAVLYVHGKGGDASEADHYRSLFPTHFVVGADYSGSTPWEVAKEIMEQISDLATDYDEILLVANSIGAFFSMNADIERYIKRAYFISPIVDMERLIVDMMKWTNVTEGELKERSVIPTVFGEDLSYDYLTYVRTHPILWRVPTEILYGECDELTSFDTISAFAKAHGAGLTVMPKGEHWFHTPDQMRFLDKWIREREGEKPI